MSASQLLNRGLNLIEKTGNHLPHPALLFVYLCAIMLLLSALAAGLEWQATHPVTGEQLQAINLLNGAGLRRILTDTVSNFVGFAPVGTVLVAIMGIGIADQSGLLRAVLTATILRAPRQLLSFFVVLAGVLSSLAADTGYVVLIPLAAILFHSAGRPPVLGIAAAFAGVSGGYSANLLIGPFDAILAGISTEAAQLIAADYEVNAAGNYYFLLVSTVVISLLGAWVTEKIAAPRFSERRTGQVVTPPADRLSSQDRRGLLQVLVATIVFAGLLLAGLLPADGALRSPATGDILRSPFISGIVLIIALYAALCGIVFGRASGTFRNSGDVISAMEHSMQTMGSYLVLMFFAAQFVSYFAWSQLGSIMAIKGALWLQALELGPGLLLTGMILVAAFINLFVGSGSAKWALLAPIFVPMLLLTGISPEATQMAFRIGDSTTNIITPLMPYFGVVVAFVQQYDKQSGIGSIIALMLPYSLVFLLGWSLLFLLWVTTGLPLGPGAAVLVP